MSGLRSFLPPHHVVRDLLAPDDHAALRDWVLSMEERFRPSLVGGKRVDPTVRHSISFAGRDDPELEPLKARARAILPDLFAALGMAAVPIDRLELELVAYGDGDFYRRHRDIPVGEAATAPRDSDRILSGVYYFHAEPKAFEGGALRLHRVGESAGDTQNLDIAPVQNSFAVFPSWVPHEVMPVTCRSGEFRHSRFAINCWFRRNRIASPAGIA